MSNNRIQILKDRAACFAKARAFFAHRNILEVDTPILSHSSPIDEYIDVLRVLLPQDKLGYLHTSPEYAMKRLIAEGCGDIYQLGHVFREGEISPKHNPEFTMVEWYRMAALYENFIEETLDFIRVFLGNLPSETISYREAFLRYADIDYLTASHADLFACTEKHGINLSSDSSAWGRAALLQLILGFVIEPHLGKDQLTVFCDYPASEAALARTKDKDGESVAERFEIYYQGVELANGFHELTDTLEQRARFEAANRARASAGKTILPIDEHFLSALSKMPDCCGVAVGFDRLMLLRHRATSLANILPFSWDFI